METAKTINAWAEATFGRIPDDQLGRGIERALEELVETFETVEHTGPGQGANLEAVKEELADVAIVLLRLAGHHGYSPECTLPDELQALVDEKMTRNRQRHWRSDGTGHGYHI